MDVLTPIRSSLLGLWEVPDRDHQSTSELYWDRQRMFTALAHKQLGFAGKTSTAVDPSSDTTPSAVVTPLV